MVGYLKAHPHFDQSGEKTKMKNIFFTTWFNHSQLVGRKSNLERRRIGKDINTIILFMFYSHSKNTLLDLFFGKMKRRFLIIILFKYQICLQNKVKGIFVWEDKRTIFIIMCHLISLQIQWNIFFYVLIIFLLAFSCQLT